MITPTVDLILISNISKQAYSYQNVQIVNGYLANFKNFCIFFYKW